MNGIGERHSPIQEGAIERILEFIPLLESGALNDAHTVYITTGEYPPPIRDLHKQLKTAALAPESHDWLTWTEQARPYLQEPKKIEATDDETFSRLLALATHSERFNKSLFPHLCSSGFMLHLLLRLKANRCH
jgi:hypothetical protein